MNNDDKTLKVTVDQLLILLGSKEVEIMLLKQRVAQMDQLIVQLQTPKPEAPV